MKDVAVVVGIPAYRVRLHRYLGDVTKGVLPGYATLRSFASAHQNQSYSKVTRNLQLGWSERRDHSFRGTDVGPYIKTGKYTHSSGVVIKLLAFLCEILNFATVLVDRVTHWDWVKLYRKSGVYSYNGSCGCIKGLVSLWYAWLRCS